MTVLRELENLLHDASGLAEELSGIVAMTASRPGNAEPTAQPEGSAPEARPGPKPLAWGAKVSAQFRDFVRQMARDFAPCDPDWLMACMAFETGETFSPSVKNPRSTATGLIQFMEATAADLGTTTQQLAAMTAEEQLKYVWMYFRDRGALNGSIRSLEDCYMAILWPKAMGQPNDTAIFVGGTRAYAVNAGLDANRDHRVTKAEAAAKVREKLVRGAQFAAV
jgi:hypothetical protein